MSRYAMNINDGRIVFNTSAVPSNINYVEIDDDTHAAIKGGKLAWQTVANAVRAKRNNDPSFNWPKYDDLRERLNVRKADFSLKGRAENGDITGVGGDDRDQSINPSVSFMELRRPDTHYASTKDNTNVGGLSHPPRAAKSEKPAEAAQGVVL